MIHVQLTLAFLLVFLKLGVVQAETTQVHEFKLDNGMRILVKEDRRSPVVVTQVWYKVGSSYEHNGLTGISHFLEHMMFKGTQKLKPNEFSEIIARNGGRENAFTGKDYTAYFQQLEKSRLAICLKLEADRMRGLTLPKAEFEKERQVVIEERRLRTEDNPQSLTYERFNATAFQSSPYRIPVIGWMKDLETMTVEEMRAWYHQWYAPNNAILVVVGDVKPADVYQLAKEHFGPLKPSIITAPKPQTEVEQSGTKRLVVKVPAQLPYVMIGYKVPAVHDATLKWEPYALDVLAGILDAGRSARLDRELVRGSSIASNVGASYDSFSRLSTLFIIHGTPAQNKTARDLELALLKQVERLKTDEISTLELKRVLAQVVAEKVFQQDSLFYQGMLIGQLETMGYSWRLADDYVANIKKVTAAQVRLVAKKYLVTDRLTVAELEPLPMSLKKLRKTSGITGGRHAN